MSRWTDERPADVCRDEKRVVRENDGNTDTPRRSREL